MSLSFSRICAFPYRLFCVRPENTFFILHQKAEYPHHFFSGWGGPQAKKLQLFKTRLIDKSRCKRSLPINSFGNAELEAKQQQSK